MKRTTKILTLIVLCLFIQNLCAQSDKKTSDKVAESSDHSGKFRFGLHFSPNISWFNANSVGYESDGSKLGYSYGLAVEHFIGKNYLFSTGFSLSPAGGTLKYNGVFQADDTSSYKQSSVSQSYSVKYIEIPITLKLRTTEIGYITYFGKIGFTPGIKYKATSEYDYSINNLGSTDPENVSKETFFMNMWLTLGLGAEYNIAGNTNIMLGLTFHNGFMNTLNNDMYKLDPVTEEVEIDATTLTPVFQDKKASANLNYFSLDIAFFF